MRKFALLIVAVTLAACSVNPVTGQRELVIMSTSQQIEQGRQAYLPMQQAQGGAYDIDPGLTTYVRRVGSAVAAQSNVDLPYEFVVLNSSVPNAWALPGGKIGINRGLLTELESEAELAAVLGHEVVHAAAGHSAQQQTRAMILQAGVMGTAIAASGSDYGNLIAGGANLAAQVGLAKYGRNAELQADRYGMQYLSAAGYNPQGAVELQQTFLRLSEGRRSNWLSGLFASHPPSQSRVDANRSTAATLPAGGREGKAEYAAAMARTMQLKPAYEAYDEGREALAGNNVDEALAAADKALDLFDGEANFHALRGDTRLVQKNYDWAVTNYTRAIERRNGFFYYHLQRGLAKKELGQQAGAVIDLERSLEMLPTAPAHYALGDLARERGDLQGAIGHYRVVAKSGGEYGKAASVELARLDLASNPGSYIAHGCSVDSRGMLVVSVRNDAPLAVRSVQVAVAYTDSLGRRQERHFDVGGRLAPGDVASVNTGMTAGSSCPVRVAVAQPEE